MRLPSDAASDVDAVSRVSEEIVKKTGNTVSLRLMLGLSLLLLIPFLSLPAADDGDEDPPDDARFTMLYPLLTGIYRSSESADPQIKGAVSLPLLAAMGEIRADRFFASGYASPYLGVGSSGFSGDDLEAERSGATILPWVPFFDDTFSLRLIGSASAESRGGSFSGKEYLTLPGLGVGLWKRRTCGIESDTSFVNLWDISLLRYGTNLRGSGFRAWMNECEMPLGLRWLSAWPDMFPDRAEDWEPAGMRRTLQGSRSGLPVDHFGLIDPMITFDRKGESIQACGIEPLFHYDADEGFSLPFLLTSFSGEGVDFGAPAVRHLFPLVHANAGMTRWGFLCNYGTVYALDDYSAVDLKMVFNYQHRPGKGTAWGFLPFIFGRYPGRELNQGVRYVQLDNHAVSWWNVEGDRGIDVLNPFLFSMNYGADYSRWRALLFFSGSTSAQERMKLTLGPFGFPFGARSDADSFSWRFLWILGYERGPEGSEFDFLGIPIVTARASRR